VKAPLFCRNLRRHAVVLGALAVGLGVFEDLIVRVAAQIDMGTGLRAFLEQIIPPAMKKGLAQQLAFASFAGAPAFGFQHPVTLVAALAFVVLAATIPAGERESGFLDLLLARPVRRSRYLIAVLGLLLAGAVLLPLALLAGAAAGLARVSVEGQLPWWRYAPCAGGLAVLLLSIGGYTLFLASGARRRGRAVGLAVGVTLLTYVIEVLADFWTAFDRIRWVSPFHYFKPIAAAVVPETPIQDPIVLLGVFAAFAVLAAARFERQDL